MLRRRTLAVVDKRLDTARIESEACDPLLTLEAIRPHRHTCRPEQGLGCAPSIRDLNGWCVEVLCPFAVLIGSAHGETLLLDIVYNVPCRSSLGDKLHARVVSAPSSFPLRRLGTSFIFVSRGQQLLLLTGGLSLRLPILRAATTADQRSERCISFGHFIVIACVSNLYTLSPVCTQCESDQKQTIFQYLALCTFNASGTSSSCRGGLPNFWSACYRHTFVQQCAHYIPTGIGRSADMCLILHWIYSGNGIDC